MTTGSADRLKYVLIPPEEYASLEEAIIASLSKEACWVVACCVNMNTHVVLQSSRPDCGALICRGALDNGDPLCLSLVRRAYERTVDDVSNPGHVNPTTLSFLEDSMGRAPRSRALR
jgi:hypothetical protein